LLRLGCLCHRVLTLGWGRQRLLLGLLSPRHRACEQQRQSDADE